MPRRTLARRFEPRYGVSQDMLEMEAKWVERELENYLLSSLSELEDGLAQGREAVMSAEQEVDTLLAALPDRERIALKVMLARDVFHIAKLFTTALRSSTHLSQASGPSVPCPAELDANDEPQPVLVFKKSLFE